MSMSCSACGASGATIIVAIMSPSQSAPAGFTTSITKELRSWLMQQWFSMSVIPTS